MMSVVLALLALGVSAAAVFYARRSAKEAKRGNDIAAEANERFSAAERRATLRHDVRWRAHWEPTTEQLVLTNDGTSAAHHVALSLRGQVRHDWDLETVQPHSTEAINLANDIVDFKLRSEASTPKGAQIIGSLTVAIRVMWEDEAGGQHDRNLPDVAVPLVWTYDPEP